MSLIVKDGAGIIGANFLFNLIESSNGALVNLDKCTYEGNLQALISLHSNPCHISVQCNICDSPLVQSLWGELCPKAYCRTFVTKITYFNDRPGSDRGYAIDVHKFKRDLYWKAAVSLETCIRKTVQWCQDIHDRLKNVQSGACKDWVSKQYEGSAI
jgi:dTDP-D-glucose 4,6-dehydratase